LTRLHPGYLLRIVALLTYQAQALLVNVSYLVGVRVVVKLVGIMPGQVVLDIALMKSICRTLFLLVDWGISDNE
jgi:hypothetical protein